MRYISLADLSQGESGTIVALHEQHHDKSHGYHTGLVNRLIALGFLPGRTVKIERRGKWGGPLQVYIGTTAIILRPSEARAIEVTPS
jgi:Fe2+ transport system protein FeoA